MTGGKAIHGMNGELAAFPVFCNSLFILAGRAPLVVALGSAGMGCQNRFKMLLPSCRALIVWDRSETCGASEGMPSRVILTCHLPGTQRNLSAQALLQLAQGSLQLPGTPWPSWAVRKGFLGTPWGSGRFYPSTPKHWKTKLFIGPWVESSFCHPCGVLAGKPNDPGGICYASKSLRQAWAAGKRRGGRRASRGGGSKGKETLLLCFLPGAQGTLTRWWLGGNPWGAALHSSRSATGARGAKVTAPAGVRADGEKIPPPRPGPPSAFATLPNKNVSLVAGRGGRPLPLQKQSWKASWKSSSPGVSNPLLKQETVYKSRG